MFDNLPEECEDLIFQYHNKNITDMNREHHKKNFNIVLDELMGKCEDCIYFFGLQDLQFYTMSDDIFYTSYLIEFINICNDELF